MRISGQSLCSECPNTALRKLGLLMRLPRTREPHSGGTVIPERACIPREGVFLFEVVAYLPSVYSHWMAWKPTMSSKAPLPWRSLSISWSMMW